MPVVPTIDPQRGDTCDWSNPSRGTERARTAVAGEERTDRQKENERDEKAPPLLGVGEGERVLGDGF